MYHAVASGCGLVLCRSRCQQSVDFGHSLMYATQTASYLSPDRKPAQWAVNVRLTASYSCSPLTDNSLDGLHEMFPGEWLPSALLHLLLFPAHRRRLPLCIQAEKVFAELTQVLRVQPLQQVQFQDVLLQTEHSTKCCLLVCDAV